MSHHTLRRHRKGHNRILPFMSPWLRDGLEIAARVLPEMKDEPRSRRAKKQRTPRYSLEKLPAIAKPRAVRRDKLSRLADAYRPKEKRNDD